MSKKKFNLICVAHPDDETIFFGGLLQRKRNRLPWKVICVTSDGSQERRTQFLKACRALGVLQSEWWAFPDKYEQRLPLPELIERLSTFEKPSEVFTHGIMGEYGHPHHQDVSFAVHKAYLGTAKVYSVAYNTFPEFEVKLTRKEFKLKAKILTKIYGSETNRFLNVLPSTSVEGFQKLSFKEVQAVYAFLSGQGPLNQKLLTTHHWLSDYLPRLRDLQRPF